MGREPQRGENSERSVAASDKPPVKSSIASYKLLTGLDFPNSELQVPLIRFYHSESFSKVRVRLPSLSPPPSCWRCLDKITSPPQLFLFNHFPLCPSPDQRHPLDNLQRVLPTFRFSPLLSLDEVFFANLFKMADDSQVSRNSCLHSSLVTRVCALAWAKNTTPHCAQAPRDSFKVFKVIDRIALGAEDCNRSNLGTLSICALDSIRFMF